MPQHLFRRGGTGKIPASPTSFPSSSSSSIPSSSTSPVTERKYFCLFLITMVIILIFLVSKVNHNIALSSSGHHFTENPVDRALSGRLVHNSWSKKNNNNNKAERAGRRKIGQDENDLVANELQQHHEDNNNAEKEEAEAKKYFKKKKLSRPPGLISLLSSRYILFKESARTYLRQLELDHCGMHDHEHDDFDNNPRLHHPTPRPLPKRHLTIKDISLMLVDYNSPQAAAAASGEDRLKMSFVHSIRNFYPENVASNFRQAMLEAWINDDDNNEEEADEDKTKKKHDFLYATNNNGVSFGPKVISREKVKERKQFALRAIQQNPETFAYSKYELRRDHPYHKVMRNYLNCRATREAVCTALGADECPSDFVEKAEIGDFFISLYEQDDFLSGHSDSILGSIAVTSHFHIDMHDYDIVLDDGRKRGDSAHDGEERVKSMKKKKIVLNEVIVDPGAEEMEEAVAAAPDPHSNGAAGNGGGGAVEFFCQDKSSWCVHLNVSRNDLTIFRTQPLNVMHRVTSMSSSKEKRRYLRFAATGWFHMSGEQAELKY